MTKQLQLQNNFSHGELDPRVYDVDLSIYYKSAKYVRNLYVRPQGGLTRRHGSNYLYTLSSGDNKFATFVYDANTAYLFVLEDSKLLIFKQTDKGLTFVYNVTSPYTAAQLPNVKFAQVTRTLYFVHPDVPPQQLTRGATDTDWALAALTFQNPPVFDYSSNYFTASFTLSSTVAGTTSTLTSTTSVFTAQHVGGLFLSIGDASNPNDAPGLARITAFTSATEVTTTIITAFNSTTNPGSTSYLGEQAFSTVRGWPSAVGSAQSRLCLGGASQAPNVIAMSKINAPLNFNVLDETDADGGLMYTLPGENHNVIQWIVSNKTVQIFGSKDTFSTTSSVIDNSNMAFSLQTDKGSSNLVQPQTLDNDVFYVQDGGKAVMRHVFTPVSGTYASSNQSIFASHLIKNPVSSAILSGDSLDNADYLFLVNSDGSLAVLQSLAEQNVLGWSLCATGDDMHDLSSINPNKGKYKSIIALNNVIYVIVERIVNTETKYYIEELDFNTHMDCTITQTLASPGTTITNLAELEAETVKVIADGYLLKNEVVTNGQITIDRPSSNVSVGLAFNVQLTPLPVNVLGSKTKYLPKRIVRTWVNYYQSLGIYVDGTPIPELKFGPNVLDTVPSPKDGTYDARLEGWSPNVTYDITQIDPLPFLVTGIGYEVEI